MSFSTQSPTLAAWLALATRGLVPSAKTRIRTEIETHFAESVQTHLTLGSSELDAQAAALADLGNPQTAAARFRREHLTKFEVNTVLFQARYARDTAGFVPLGDLGFLLLLFLLGLGYLRDWVYRPFFGNSLVFYYAAFLLLIISYASLSIAVDVAARCKPALATACRIFWLGSIKSLMKLLTQRLLFFAFIYSFFRLNLDFANDPFYGKIYLTACAGLFLLWILKEVVPLAKQTYFNLRLRKKLASAHEADFPGLHPDPA